MINTFQNCVPFYACMRFMRALSIYVFRFTHLSIGYVTCTIDKCTHMRETERIL